MSELLERHRQILEILRVNPNGLTNRGIMDIAKTMRGNELPNDMTQMAVNAQSLRRRDLLTTTDTTAGKIHQITEKGRAMLGANNTTKEPQAAEPETDNLPVKTYPLSAIADAIDEPESPASSTDTHARLEPDPLAEFDKAAAIMRQCIQDALIDEQLARISGKARKITLLEQLENTPFFSGPDRETLAEIRADLEQLEAAE